MGSGSICERAWKDRKSKATADVLIMPTIKLVSSKQIGQILTVACCSMTA